MPTTIGSWLKSASALLTDSDSPQLDAELLLCHALDENRTVIYAWPDKTLDQATEQQLQQLLQRRVDGEPIAYIVGSQEFYGLNFSVSNAVLVPRPETEQLVELVLNELHTDQETTVLDAGTGSGAIAIAIAHEAAATNKRVSVVASDESHSALLLARQNVHTLMPNAVSVVRSDWLTAFANHSFNIIVSNPPYIRENDPHLQNLALTHEPQQALASGEDGLSAIREIVADAIRVLKPNGLLLLEHGYDQAEAIREIMQAHGYTQITTHTDLAGLDRICTGISPTN